MRRSYVLSLVFCASAFALSSSFQNCGGFQSSKNSLLSAAPAALCTGACLSTVDTLDFFLTKHPDKALKETATGTEINQVIDLSRRRVYLMKWGPRSFVGYTWDDAFIYFLEEHEMDFPNAQASALNYSFAPGYWFKRRMQVGESLDGTASGPFQTVITYYDSPHTCNVASSAAYPMKTILESHLPGFAIGGDLGVQDVIVPRLEQGSFSEKETYSREWGLVRWQHCTLDGSTCDTTVTFNTVAADPPRAVDRTAACVNAFN